jgi:hypothetical protein
MPTRRNFLLVAGGALFATKVHAAEPAVAPTKQAAAPAALTLSDQLMHSTVRLFNKTADTEISGTGFIFALFKTEDSSIEVIVTNRHVVESLGDSCSFTLARRKADGSPDLDNHLSVVLDDFKHSFIPHPNVDLAIIPLGQLLKKWESENVVPYIVSFENNLIPTTNEVNNLTAIEQVLTVGFPGQLWDDVHDLPVFHRGYTATAPYINFKGKDEFLIDIATWPGASGSPVILFDQGSYALRQGGVAIGSRFKLLGVVYGVAVQDVHGAVLIQNAPTRVAVPGTMSVPTNLGACIDSSRILEFEPLLVSMGVQPPLGYVMRAKSP